MAKKENKSILSLSLADAKKQIKELEEALGKLEKGSTEYNDTVIEINKQIRDYYSETGKLIKANAILEGSYDDISRKMSVLKMEMKSTNDEARRNELSAQINELNDTLKQFDAANGVYSRNVGNYANDIKEALSEVDGSYDRLLDSTTQLADESKSVSQRFGEVEDKLRELAVAGKENTDEYKQLVKEAGNLKRAMDSTSQAIDNQAMAMGGIRQAVDVMQTVTSVIGVYEGAMAALGIENEEVGKTIAKLNGLMAVTNSLQEINEALTNKSSAAYKVMNTVMKALNTTMGKVSFGVMGAALAALIYLYDKYMDKLEETKLKLEEQKRYTDVANQAVLETKGKLMLLQDAYSKAGKSMKEKEKFLKKNASAFSALGVEVKNVADMENLLVKNTDKFIEAQKKKALSAAYMEDWVKANKEALELEKKFNETSSTRTQAIGTSSAGTVQYGEVVNPEKQKAFDAYNKALDKVNEISAKMKSLNSETDTLMETFTSSGAETAKQAKDLVVLAREEFEHRQKIKNLQNEVLKITKETKESENIQHTVNATKERVVFITEQLDKLKGVKGKEDEILALTRELETENANLLIQQAQLNKAKKDELNTEKEKAKLKAQEKLTGDLDKMLLDYDTQQSIAEIGGDKEAVYAIEDAKYQAHIDYLNKMRGTTDVAQEIAEINMQIAEVEADWKIAQEQRVADAKKEQQETDKRQADDEKALWQQRASAAIQAAQSIGNCLGNISAIMEENINKQVEEGKISEEQAEKEFERVKKLQLSEVWINTLAGAAGAYMQAISSLGPWLGIPVGTANFAAAMALGIAQTKQIKAQTFGGGGGGGINGVQAIATQPLLDDTETLNNMTSMQIMGGYTQTDTRVYILESDIQESISRVEVRESQSDF